MSAQDLQLIGVLAKAFIDNARIDDTYSSVLSDHGLEHIKDDEWVSVKKLNIVIADLVERRQSFDSTFDMVAVGIAAAKNAVLPEGMTFVDFLTTQNEAIQEIYRGSNKGRVEMEVLSDTHYILDVYLPWEDNLLYGNYYGYAKRRYNPKKTWS